PLEGVRPALPAEILGFQSEQRKRPAAKTRLRKRLLTGRAASLLLAGAGYNAYDRLVASPYVTTDDAYGGAAGAQINSQVSGSIAKVAVDDTQAVHKGDVLAVI